MSKVEKYPRIGNARPRAAWKKVPIGAPKCIVSGCCCRATHRVDVEVNYFRGDDEVGNVCDQHKGNAAAVLHGIEANRKKQDAHRQTRATEGTS